ncbi:DUF4920 domain-containing protein [Hymenobacter persicinus]|uniref:DUF4920 domain-containing protein n=1 Tax=Hymenobacter persicinus TaxID=2025506 RepID=A0A4Q5LCD5_9BACT|nr:DUF4920 domain-containing protein [Hymenobacter persicinus]RYU80496.1 DUF4920 domain-containing protein [Hymenobacter persicinus]
MRVTTLLLASALTALAACQAAPATDTATAPATPAPAAPAGKTYGAPLTAAGARPMSELSQVLGNQDSAQVKLVGKASGVCQAKGCWLTMATPDGRQMRVRFKDYAFFVPKDLTGKTVVINGWAHREQVPVSDLQHYAKDAGKSAKEVAAITQPEEQLNFEADGVLVQE